MATDSKPKGWFSRRHETSREHDHAVASWQATHGPEARRARALDRATHGSSLSREERQARGFCDAMTHSSGRGDTRLLEEVFAPGDGPVLAYHLEEQE